MRYQSDPSDCANCLRRWDQPGATMMGQGVEPPQRSIPFVAALDAAGLLAQRDGLGEAARRYATTHILYVPQSAAVAATMASAYCGPGACRPSLMVLETATRHEALARAMADSCTTWADASLMAAAGVKSPIWFDRARAILAEDATQVPIAANLTHAAITQGGRMTNHDADRHTGSMLQAVGNWFRDHPHPRKCSDGILIQTLGSAVLGPAEPCRRLADHLGWMLTARGTAHIICRCIASVLTATPDGRQRFGHAVITALDASRLGSNNMVSRVAILAQVATAPDDAAHDRLAHILETAAHGSGLQQAARAISALHQVPAAIAAPIINRAAKAPWRQILGSVTPSQSRDMDAFCRHLAGTVAGRRLLTRWVDGAVTSLAGDQAGRPAVALARLAAVQEGAA